MTFWQFSQPSLIFQLLMFGLWRINGQLTFKSIVMRPLITRCKRSCTTSTTSSIGHELTNQRIGLSGRTESFMIHPQDTDPKAWSFDFRITPRSGIRRFWFITMERVVDINSQWCMPKFHVPFVERRVTISFLYRKMERMPRSRKVFHAVLPVGKSLCPDRNETNS
jgi:hypothetical protein